MTTNSGATGASMPSTNLTMSSREIAELTEKRHDNVMRDIRKMMSDMPEPGALKIEAFKTKDLTGDSVSHYLLPKRETIILVSGYDVRLRARIIDRWMELEAIAASRLPAFDGRVTDLSAEVRGAVGGIVKGIVHKEVAEALTSICATLLPEMLRAALAGRDMMIRRGKTAGQILRDAGFPPIKGLAGWFSGRLVALGYSIEGEGRSEQGGRTARLFDPDKVALWLRTGGRVAVEQKIAERRGQGVLRLVSVPITDGAPPSAR